MKKHKYDPDLVDRIVLDPDYFLLLAAYHFIQTKDKLFLPKLRKNGDYTIKCFFHKENTPSLRYSEKLSRYKCFGCGCSGNMIGLYQKYFNTGFYGAIKMALSFKKVLRELKEKEVINKSTQLHLEFLSSSNKNEDDLPF